MAAITTELQIVNLALDALGQSELSAAEYAAAGSGEGTPADVMARHYDAARLRLLRSYPYEFAIKEKPLVQVDAAGMLVQGASITSINGTYTWDSDLERQVNDDTDFYAVKESDVWNIYSDGDVLQLHAHTTGYAHPWDVPLWIADVTCANLPMIYPGSPRDFTYLYSLPSDCIAPLKVWNAYSRDSAKQIRFRPLHNGYIGADADGAVLRYTKDADDISEWDDTTKELLAVTLAMECYVPIKGSTKDIQTLRLMHDELLLRSQNADAQYQHEDKTQTEGRRYIDL